MRPLVVLFARNPVPGRVKTRLGMSPDRASALHEAFVRDALHTIATLDGVDTELSTDEPCAAWPDWTGRRSVQPAGSLGDRVYAAIKRALDEGRNKVMVLGSDSPGLPATHISELLRSSADIALGPADDGGYYAIACRRADSRMFEGVRWSSDSALTDTVRAAEACGLSVEIGPQWFDVDTPVDLERLRALPHWRWLLE
jgi:rSAM/selenodomain-associated transferase 1